MKRTLIRLGLSALVSAALFGCGGGGDGVSTSSTVTVPVGPATSGSTVASNTSTPSSASVQAWRALQPTITVTGVSIHSPPVVSFAVTDATGAGVVGLGNRSLGTSNTSASVSALTNLSFTLAKLVPATATSPSKWVSYLVVKPLTVAQAAGTFAATDSCTTDKKWCGTYPTTDKEGTLVDNGDGTYKYTFYRDITQAASLVSSLTDSTDGLKLKADLGDLTYDPTATHRLGVIISGAAPGTGSNTPTATTILPAVNIAIAGNLVYDFRPDGGAVTSTRSVVDMASCSSCHNGKGLAHGGSRKDPNLCVTCHTDQVKYGMSGEATRASALVLNGTIQNTTSVLSGRAIGNFPNFAHKIHMGDKLSLSGYNYIPSSGVGMQFEKEEWIQDPRNCTKCHSGVDKTDINQATKTKDGDNWKTKPNRLACGACHDNVDFATGIITETTGTRNHTAGAAADDSSCSSCHTPAGIAESHRSEAPTANNPVQLDGISTISYEIKTVALNGSRQPQITFRIKMDGAYLTSFPVATTAVSSGAVGVSSTFEPIPGFRSGPTFYVAYAVPQDGITAPADFNTYQSASLSSLLVSSGSPKAGSITGPDADGYFVATLTGDTVGQPVTGSCTQKTTTETGYCVNRSGIKVPTTAKMVTGAMIGNFTQITFSSSSPNYATLVAKYGNGGTAGSVSTGVVIKTPLQQKLATITGNTARRVVVDTNKCESCHEQLGTAVDFHGGARNDGTACAICHNTSRTSGGWSANASTFVHGIHAGTDPASVIAAKAVGTANVGDPGAGGGGAGTGYSSGKRYVPFSWHRDKAPGVAGGFNAAAVSYPGILKTCDNCHVPNAVNFGIGGSTLFPNLLWSTSGTGTYSSTDTPKVYPRDPVTGALKYIATGTNYGNLFSFTPEGSVIPKITTSGGGNNSNALQLAGAGGVTVAADTATLIESPVTSACFACHDTSTAKSHMTQYGGVIYGTRTASGGATLVNGETCLICHGYGRDQDAAVVHAK